MVHDTIHIDSFDGLNLRIRTVGYPDGGESIMVSLLDTDKYLCNVVIDNYEDNGYQHWLTLLPDDCRIDAFIWTHPDEDHSQGVERLLSRHDPERKAEIFIPISLTQALLEANNKTEALPCYNYLKDNYNKRRKYQWHEVSVEETEGYRPLFKRKIINREDNNVLDFKIGFMLPNSAVVNRMIDKDMMNPGEMNDLSLFTVIEINSARYIFAGDLAKRNIQFLDDDYLSNFRFVKIPHHGSKDPIKLADKIQPLSFCDTHSATTVFGYAHPFEDVLDKYENKCKSVYCTGRGVGSYGMVEISYNINNLDIYRVSLSGNAECVRPKHALTRPS